jgi:hypothetical protein
MTGLSLQCFAKCQKRYNDLCRFFIVVFLINYPPPLQFEVRIFDLFSGFGG